MSLFYRACACASPSVLLLIYHLCLYHGDLPFTRINVFCMYKFELQRDLISNPLVPVSKLICPEGMRNFPHGTRHHILGTAELPSLSESRDTLCDSLHKVMQNDCSFLILIIAAFWSCKAQYVLKVFRRAKCPPRGMQLYNVRSFTVATWTVPNVTQEQSWFATQMESWFVGGTP